MPCGYLRQIFLHHNSCSLDRFWGDADVRLVAYMVPDLVPGVDLGSNGLPKVHPQDRNSYLFSIDVKHESNHPEMSVKNSSFSLDNPGVHSPRSVGLTGEVSAHKHMEPIVKKKSRVGPNESTLHLTFHGNTLTFTSIFLPDILTGRCISEHQTRTVTAIPLRLSRQRLKQGSFT